MRQRSASWIWEKKNSQFWALSVNNKPAIMFSCLLFWRRFLTQYWFCYLERVRRRRWWTGICLNCGDWSRGTRKWWSRCRKKKISSTIPWFSTSLWHTLSSKNDIHPFILTSTALLLTWVLVIRLQRIGLSKGADPFFQRWGCGSLNIV